MRTVLGDPARVQHQDLVGGGDGGEPVGDDEGGAAVAEGRKRGLDVLLRFAV